ncbi:hypothetical protein CEXT_703031 [Caerostris extrusa]|uniref:Uncharacterized protein n=1 Tax=Caerostris extrusa TaxID=172846 RepID=A0AAV4XV63_CAEEX|nr:hypothetical protein CEXT_703031 [Caerostris extrusa]
MGSDSAVLGYKQDDEEGTTLPRRLLGFPGSVAQVCGRRGRRYHSRRINAEIKLTSKIWIGNMDWASFYSSSPLLLHQDEPSSGLDSSGTLFLQISLTNGCVIRVNSVGLWRKSHTKCS